MTSQPLQTILHIHSQSGKLAKWAIALNEYETEYRLRTSAKVQVLALFRIELAPQITSETSPDKNGHFTLMERPQNMDPE